MENKIEESITKEKKEFVIYQNDFCDSDIWKQICEEIGVDYEFDKLTLVYTKATVSNSKWGE